MYPTKMVLDLNIEKNKKSLNVVKNKKYNISN